MFSLHVFRIEYQNYLAIQVFFWHDIFGIYKIELLPLSLKDGSWIHL